MTINTFDRPREAINLFKILISFDSEKLRVYKLRNSPKNSLQQINY